MSWRLCLQSCTLSFTIEAEYVAVSSVSKEVVWLSRLVGDLGEHQVQELHCDNQSAIALAKNPMFHSKSKHIKVKYHVIWDILASKRIDIVKVHMDDNPVDALTKSLSSKWFAHCIELMGVGQSHCQAPILCNVYWLYLHSTLGMLAFKWEIVRVEAKWAPTLTYTCL